ncbi:M23 family metallopeptidase [Stenotrophomonas tumulicola]|uniref:Beta-lytic metalloendopeptidase n=1 Tax=Stenotrophomonas tumulicola TaxID=1685415 RepID=A0A7W3FMT6_9GAMM|nr:M23 family metallopeptidase [Stenotrophomonas tumulicola]MBA8682409.1 beta-lytic metalloendopeptidase [Stenotrophomonas tumulicola]
MTIAKNLFLTPTLIAMLCATGVATDAHADQPPLRSQDLVYGYDEMFDFDIAGWLATHAPHLSAQAETISHWAGFSGISPKALIALMELHSGVVGNVQATAGVMQRPFGTLVARTGFGPQLREVAETLRDAMYDHDDTRTSGPVALSKGNPLRTLYAVSGLAAARGDTLADTGFTDVYRRLFNTSPQARPASRFIAAQPMADTPPTNLLQFPYPLGEKWHVGGAHTNSGWGRFPMSSLDMFKGGGWGSNLSNHWVSASAAGTFKRHSSCMAEIVHAGGWSTTYYHLMNIRHATGAEVGANAPIANPANTRSQALCNGGRSTGPHEHWSLKSNGRQHHLNGVTLSSYLIKATGSSYDTNCTRFNLSRNGRTYCADWYTNIGVDAP